jgi:hypothetical protein
MPTKLYQADGRQRAPGRLPVDRARRFHQGTAAVDGVKTRNGRLDEWTLISEPVPQLDASCLRANLG